MGRQGKEASIKKENTNPETSKRRELLKLKKASKLKQIQVNQ